MTPTAGTIYSLAQIESDPVRLNTNLGYYTNFVNLLDLAAVSVPAGFRDDGLPFGVTLVGRAGSDDALLVLSDRLHRSSVERLGALDLVMPQSAPLVMKSLPDEIQVVVCGAHMSGLPLNHQLRDREARLVRSTRTSPSYRLFALPGGPPKRPGLLRVKEGGLPIDVEVWAVPSERFGSFVAGIPSPLGIGKVELEDGSSQPGFLCEPWGIDGAVDITTLRGWRAYLASESSV
jgi:allophanate hydrolase